MAPAPSPAPPAPPLTTSTLAVDVTDGLVAAHAAFVASIGAVDVGAAARVSLVVAAQLPAMWGLILDPARGLSFMRVSHVAHDVSVDGDLGAVVGGDRVVTDASVVGIADGPTGDLVTILLQSRTGAGAPLLSTRCTLLRREPRRRGQDLTATPPTLSTTTPTQTASLKTTLPMSQAWAAASGDGNPIFVDDEAALLAGLPGPIFGTAPVFMMALVAAKLPRRLGLTFRRPVVVGDDVVVRNDGAGIIVNVASEDAIAFGNVGGAA